MKVAVIGGGISGISAARMLQQAGHSPVVFEAADDIGGLIRCRQVQGLTYHLIGGHVFNSKTPEVLDWFWQFFDRDTEFLKATRQARIWLDGQLVGYPIENYLWQLPADLGRQAVDEVLQLPERKPLADYASFEEFLRHTFGQTLFEHYFKPYNEKIWQVPIASISMDWLAGKLPMPTPQEIVHSNIFRQEEGDMVHSSFYYASQGGSQFIIRRLAEGLDVRLNSRIESIGGQPGKLTVAGEEFERVVFCGDVRSLSRLWQVKGGADPADLTITEPLVAHGTSNMLCTVDAVDTSWLYIPDPGLKAHRIIYTGNFSPANNGDLPKGRISCVVEFSGHLSPEEMSAELPRLPGHLQGIAHNHHPSSYVIQQADTRQRVEAAKAEVGKAGVHLLGRFGEWEYYNMDKAMEAAMELVKELEQ